MLRFLAWFCPPKLYEGIEGDLLEQFEREVEELGVEKAKRKLMWNVIRFFRPEIILRNGFSIQLIQWGMIRSHLKVAWRSMLRNRSYAFINVTGLTLGLTIAIVLFWIAKFEYGFDGYHINADRLCQIKMHNKFGEPQSHVPQGVIKAMKEQIPGIEKAANVLRWDPQVIRVGNKNLKQGNSYFLNPEFLDMIDVKWKSGSPEKSLNELYQVVLDEPTARKLFQDEDPLGKTIRYDNAMDLVVSGIIEKVPVQSDLQFEMILSYKTLTKYQKQYTYEDHWGGGDSWFHGYVLVKEHADARAIENQMTALLAEHKDNTSYASLELSPLAKAHFDVKTDAFNYVIPRWMINVLLSIAIFLITIASINFINLSTAQATYRSREIGVRKVMGSSRGSIMTQFFTETAVMVTLSVLLASGLATQLVPYANDFFNTKVNQIRVWDLDMVFYLTVLTLSVTILSGFYPALLLSGFQPVTIFRNQISVLSGKSASLRKSLVVAQFVIAQVMVICMVVGIQQIRFFYDTDIGFNRDGILTVAMPYADSVLLQDRFRQRLLQHSEIRDVTYGLTSPSSNRNWWWGDTRHPGLLDGEQSFRLQWIDHNYLKFYNIPLLAGRNFVESDTARLALINEKALHDMGFKDPERALGERLTFWGSNTVTVIGVVKNYYSQGLKSEVPPHLYMFGDWNFQLAQIKIDPSNAPTAIAHIRKYWQDLHPESYFEYEFLSDSLNVFYEDERKLSNFIILFAVVGMVIGCMGLFGLVSFVCMKRTKEVSIRKVLGATVSNIIAMLSRDFMMLVLLAFVIAIPIGWCLMSEFLQQYTYHTQIHWAVFALAGFLTVVLALITVGWKAFKTALTNPAENLKYE